MEVVQPKDSLHFTPRLGKESGVTWQDQCSTGWAQVFGHLSGNFRLVWHFMDFSKIPGALSVLDPSPGFDLPPPYFFFFKKTPTRGFIEIQTAEKYSALIQTRMPSDQGKGQNFWPFNSASPQLKTNTDGESRK